jgi:hypothetical protein
MARDAFCEACVGFEAVRVLLLTPWQCPCLRQSIAYVLAVSVVRAKYKELVCSLVIATAWFAIAIGLVVSHRTGESTLDTLCTHGLIRCVHACFEHRPMNNLRLTHSPQCMAGLRTVQISLQNHQVSLYKHHTSDKAQSASKAHKGCMRSANLAGYVFHQLILHCISRVAAPK